MQTAIATTGHGGRRQGGVGHPKDAYVPVDVRERLVVAKADKEEHLARLAALEVAEKERTLISASEVVKASQRAGMAVRDAVLSVPGRIAAQLVGMDDERAIERLIADALRAELTRLADTVPRRGA
jgi:phage terminase Nu1 subunit (DNA packaging protein)